jgi:hypothetical protein
MVCYNRDGNLDFMSNPEFEHSNPFTGEIDWSPETVGIKDFSAASREVLWSQGKETIFLNGQSLTDLIGQETVERLKSEHARFGFDFIDLRTRRSEVAIERSLFLPNDKGKTWLEENIQLYNYESELRNIDELRSVHVCRGNLADYVAIYAWIVEQRLHLNGLRYFNRSATTNSFYGGNNSLAIKLLEASDQNRWQARLPNFDIRNIQMHENNDEIRLVPVILPA